jgi:hypothetical protein
MRQPPFGTAMAEVLLKLTNPTYSDGVWVSNGDRALFENRAMTYAVCQRLARGGYLDETINETGTASTYRVNSQGQLKAEELRYGR